jgi:hypothetical protein
VLLEADAVPVVEEFMPTAIERGARARVRSVEMYMMGG